MSRRRRRKPEPPPPLTDEQIAYWIDELQPPHGSSSISSGVRGTMMSLLLEVQGRRARPIMGADCDCEHSIECPLGKAQADEASSSDAGGDLSDWFPAYRKGNESESEAMP
jgi:hypothetical protein